MPVTSLYLQGHMITGTVSEQLCNGNQLQVYRDNVGTAITATESNNYFEGNLHSEISKLTLTSYFPKLKLKLKVHLCKE